MKKFVIFLILFFVIQSQENHQNSNNSQNNTLNNSSLNSNNTLNNSHLKVNSSQQEINKPNANIINNTQKIQNSTTNSNNTNNNLNITNNNLNITNNNKTEQENKKCNRKIGPINIPEGAREKFASIASNDPLQMAASGPINLTEALINFYNQNLKNGTNSVGNTGDEKRDKLVEENMKKFKEEMEKHMKEQEIQKRANEHFESRRKAEMIRIEKEKIEMQKQKQAEEREKFEEELINTTFSENFNLLLDRGEKEKLYLDLDLDQNIVMAFFVSDQEEKIKLTIYGPDTSGKMISLFKLYKRNYFLIRFNAKRKGEYIVELWNTGSKENEINFFINENVDKKGLLNTEKIDTISLLLRGIKKNINKLKRKKNNEIMLVNAHNDKVNKNNKSIVVYSIIEIITMIFIFVGQSYYIKSVVKTL
jgi:hypothetical protein